MSSRRIRVQSFRITFWSNSSWSLQFVERHLVITTGGFAIKKHVFQFVNDLTDKFHKAMQIAEKEAKKARIRTKQWYDKNFEERILHPGQLVLLHIPIEGKPLATDLHGPYEILEKKGTVIVCLVG